MMTRTGLGGCLVFWALAFAGPLFPQRDDRTGTPDGSRELADLEDRLFDLTNGERQEYGLRPVRLSMDLTQLARRHSADMAGHDRLSHDSSTGESYKDRLVTAGFYFSRAGENVARSGVDLPDLIHGLLMASPGHRENILNPDFDAVGIGARVSDDGVFFITQDFLKPLEALTPEQSYSRALLRIQQIRRARAVPPLDWDKKADALAWELAQARAAGRDLPAIPASFGEVYIFFAESPGFDDLENYGDEIGRPDCREGGLGIAFGRSKDNPGGAYFMALVLFPGNQFLELDEAARIEVVRATINGYRQAKGARQLLWKDALAQDADVLRSTSNPTRRQGLRGAAIGRQEVVLTYETVDLKRIPAGLEASILDPNLSGIGLRIAFEKTREFPRGAFQVMVVVE